MCAISPGIPRYPSIRVESLARPFLILTALKTGLVTKITPTLSASTSLFAGET